MEDKLHFCLANNKFLLPPPNDLAFTSVESLQAHLCEQGVPLPPGTDTAESIMTDKEEMVLKCWVRYNIAVPLLHGKTVLPGCKIPDKREAEYILQKMGLTQLGGFYKIPDGWIPQKDSLCQSWSHVENMLTKFGIPDNVVHDENVSTKEEKIGLMLYLTENVNVQTL